MRANPTALVNLIERSVIGSNKPFATCFGEKPLIYADYTASGRSLTFIEDYIRDEVLPWYANTHTETSRTGAQSTKFREEARQIIRRAVNGSDEDKVIFCGSGATTGINKIIDILGIRLPQRLDKALSASTQINDATRPVVFIGPYEHHSNELPWRESIATVVSIPLNQHGQIDQDVLRSKLEAFSDRPMKIGSFSAASNVTGIRSDVIGITALLKRHGALSFWDYAAAGPYVPIDMNGSAPIDAIFISPHKFVGGPGTPGILIAKSHLLKNPVPAIVGGGTVMYVTPEEHVFTADPERREEGGTPAIVESVRAGLVFKLKEEVGSDYIEELEHSLVHTAMSFFNNIPQIEVLGEQDESRLSIFSLRFKHQGQDLHYGFITALLNDLFGIQVRGGCSCAGPYGHHLLDMDIEWSKKLEAQIQQGVMVLRPGWVRLNFNYFIDTSEFNYILKAIELTAKYGWRLLPYYRLDELSSVWRFQGEGLKANATGTATDINGTPIAHSASLFDLAFSQALSKPAVDKQDIQSTPQTPDFDSLLEQAKNVLLSEHVNWHTFSVELSEEAESLRWFVLPQECVRTNLLMESPSQHTVSEVA